MNIVYISTYLNHHNKPLCDALYSLTGGQFTYIATSRISNWRKRMGFNGMSAQYLLDYTQEDNKILAHEKIDKADVVLAGASESIIFLWKRLRDEKLTFRISERLFKTRSRYLKAPAHFFRCMQTRNAYMLCCSAATAHDYNLLGFYKRKCYKWGYFTEVKPIEPAVLWEHKLNGELKHPGVSILWVGRLIELKHPETAVLALYEIKKAGFQFDFNIIGDGELKPKLKRLICSLEMEDCVHLLGAKSTTEVRRYMEDSEIYLFTSDRQEGWGAVLNESMSCACAVVANSEIGAVPFLIKDKVNGMIFSKGSVDSLVKCLLPLMKSESYRKQLGIAAYNTISENWTPQKAAENLLALISSIQNGTECPIIEGPGSVSK